MEINGRSCKTRALSKALQRVANEELNEDVTRIPREIADLRYWIIHQMHLKARINNDQFLLSILRGCKHNMEKAKRKIDAFYTVRQSMRELFEDRDIMSDRLREILRLGVGVPLPQTLTECSPRVLLIRAGCYDATKYNLMEILKVGLMIQDVQYLEDDHLTVAGDVAIIDLANVSATQFFQITPSLLKKLLLLKQDGSPLRQKALHFINIPPGFEFLASAGKKLLTEKNRDRIHVHPNMETLYEHIPIELFPEEYGGQVGTIEDIVDEWERKLRNHRDYLLEEVDFGTDETKRTRHSELAQNVYGMMGTFRQLEID